MQTKIDSITKVNDVEIQIVENGNGYFIPVRPICDALGIDANGQRQRIERDQILSPKKKLLKAVSKDGKKYKMICLPVKYFFGWIFSIDTARVNKDVHNEILKRKWMCYDALYDYLSENKMFVSEKQSLINSYFKELKKASNNKKDLKNNA